MDWKSKANSVIFWGIILLVGSGIATTAYVSTIAEAQAKLGTSQSVTLTGCKVYSITKTATSVEELSKDWEVNYALEYSYEQDGKMVATREGVRTAFVSTDSEAAVKAAVEPACEKDWTAAQARYGVIDTVVVEQKTNPVLSQIYDPAKKAWNSLTASQVS